MKKLNSSLAIYALTLGSLVSCAGTESYESKMSRYTPKVTGKNQVPDFKSDQFQFKNSPSRRAPASIQSTAVSAETPINNDNSLSNKKLYFLTLFGQYEIMKKYAQDFIAPNVNICPHFHTSLVEHNDRKAFAGKSLSIKNEKRFSYDQGQLSNPEYVAARVELSLPLSKEEVNPKVVDLLRSEKNINETRVNEIVHQALDIHLSKTYSEIRELCEYGVSDNYYIYENLITHIKNSEFKPVPRNMDTLLKTTLFSNLALVSSLEKTQESTPSRGIASVEVTKNKDASIPYANEVMTRLNVEWAKEYFEHLKNSR